MYLSRFANMLWFIFGCSGVVKKVRYKNVEEAVQFFLRNVVQISKVVQPQNFYIDVSRIPTYDVLATTTKKSQTREERKRERGRGVTR